MSVPNILTFNSDSLDSFFFVTEVHRQAVLQMYDSFK